MRVGVGFRYPLQDWIESETEEIECLEITAEHFYQRNTALLANLAKKYPLYLHSIGLSIGTPGGLDQGLLKQLKSLVDIAKPEWVSEHIAFTRTEDVDLGHLNPLAPTFDNLDIVVDHVIEISESIGSPLILENITSHLLLSGDMREAEFINAMCEKANCGLLLDVTNLLVNAKNHNYDPFLWLGKINPSYIRQLHIVGYSKIAGSYEDIHAEAIQPEIYTLLETVVRYSNCTAVIVERDRDFPDISELSAELRKIKRITNESELNKCHHSISATVVPS